MIFFTVVAVVNFRVHFDKVYYSAEGIFLAYGQFDGYGICVKSFAHHLHRAGKVSAVYIHFVDVRNTGNMIFVRLTPNRFGLGLYAAFRAKCCNRAVQNAQRTLYLYGKVNVSRSVYNVYTALVLLRLSASCPMAGSSGGSNGNSAFLFLYHPVHSCRAVVGFAYLMVYTGVKQNTFGSGCFTGVYVRHNTDVSGMQ